MGDSDKSVRHLRCSATLAAASEPRAKTLPMINGTTCPSESLPLSQHDHAPLVVHEGGPKVPSCRGAGIVTIGPAPRLSTGSDLRVPEVIAA